jgi:oligosaccharide repeat unit polymerase
VIALAAAAAGHTVTAGERIAAGGAGLALVGAAVWRFRRARGGWALADPLTLFWLGWGAVLLLFAIPWVRYTESSLRAWIAVYGSIAAFSLGALAVYRRLPRGAGRPRDDPDPRRLRLVWLAALVLGLAGFAAYVHAVDAVVGWRSLFDHLDLVRNIQTTSARFDEVYGRWRLLTYFNQMAFLLWTVGLRAGAFRGRWALAAPIGLVSVVPFFFTGERGLLVTALVWTACFHLVWRPLPNLRRIGAIAVVGGVAVLGFFLLVGERTDKTINSHPEVAAALTTQDFRGVALPYVYVTGNVPTLSKLMEDPIRPHTDGRMTVLPLVKVAHAAGVGGAPPQEVGAFYPIPFETFNNYSWLGTYFLDFGLAGALVLPLLGGALAALVLAVAARRRTLLAAWTASLALYVVVLSPLLNKLSTTLTWQYLALGPIVVPLIREKGVQLRPRLVRSRAWAGRHPVAALAAGGAILLALAGGIVAYRSRGPSAPELLHRMRHAAQQTMRVAQRSGLPGSAALASQLKVADPDTRFVAVKSLDARPRDVGTVGVFATHDDVYLRARPRAHADLLLHVIVRGPGTGIYVQPARVRNLLTGGDLEGLPRAPWGLRTSRSTYLLGDRRSPQAGKATLRVSGTSLPGGSYLTQVIRRLPRSAPGSLYTLRIRVLSRDLTKPASAAMKFNYADGTGQFFPAYRGTAGFSRNHSNLGIPKNSHGWIFETASGRARKRLSSIQIYPFATTKRFVGSFWVDAVSVVAGDGFARFR